MPPISPARRHPSGQIIDADTAPKKETMEQILSVAKWQRERLGATEDNYRAQEWGSNLGQMRAWAITSHSASEGLSRQQHSALETYIIDRHRARLAEGFPRDTTKAMAIDDTPMGGYSEERLSDDDVYRLRAIHNSARSALLQHAGAGTQWVKLVDMLARDENSPEYWRMMLGEVRSAANVLVRHYGL